MRLLRKLKLIWRSYKEMRIGLISYEEYKLHIKLISSGLDPTIGTDTNNLYTPKTKEEDEE